MNGDHEDHRYFKHAKGMEDLRPSLDTIIILALGKHANRDVIVAKIQWPSGVKQFVDLRLLEKQVPSMVSSIRQLHTLRSFLNISQVLAAWRDHHEQNPDVDEDELEMLRVFQRDHMNCHKGKRRYQAW